MRDVVGAAAEECKLAVEERSGSDKLLCFFSFFACQNAQRGLRPCWSEVLFNSSGLTSALGAFFFFNYFWLPLLR